MCVNKPLDPEAYFFVYETRPPPQMWILIRF